VDAFNPGDGGAMKRWMGLGALITALGATAACSGLAVLNAAEPAGGVAVVRDIAYGPGPRGRLDVYRPARGEGPAPVVVFFYGGGWDSGRKDLYAFVGRALARRGLVAVIPDYRVYPEARWPDFVQDSAKAVAWARVHAAEHGGDPGELYLMGHSAGAYNAVMLAVDRRWLGAEGLDPRRDLKGVIGLAGPYDFLPLRSDRLKVIFGPEAQRPDTQPINHVDGANPPLLLVTDVADKVVDPGNTTRMAARVRAAGGPVETRAYAGVSHSLMIAAVAAPLRFLAPVFDDAVGFVQAHARRPAVAQALRLEPQP
jgi:acetyl esterase/lipase